MLNIFKKEETNNSEPVACIFIGRSGCGKGTQVDLFKNKLNEINGLKILHAETGAFFRKFIQGDLYTEKLSKSVVETGGLMPEAFAVLMWSKYLVDNFTGKENIIFDGAPRKLMEAELLDGIIKFYNISKYKVIYINVSKDWASARLLARGRKDDTEEGINKRMSWFDKDVLPCVEFFKNNPACEVVDINGEQSIEEVHKEIISKVFGE